MMDLSFILQVTREFGLNGGTECVAFELHRAWLSMGMDARVLTSHATEPEAQELVSLAASWLKHWSGAKLRHLFTLIAVPLFTVVSTWKLARARNPALHEKFRAAGLETATEYDWNKIARQYLALFEELNKESALGPLRTFGQPASLAV